jgi:homogentisate 1,2-dioxygenase
MKEWIAFPKIEGEASLQAHADFPGGTYEREMGKEGFFGPTTHFYHKHAPTGWVEFEGPLKPRAFDTNKIIKEEQSLPWEAPLMLANADCHIQMWQFNSSMEHLYRNADGDQLLFIHQGIGDLYCDFGHLAFSEGDYLMLPKGTMWRIELASDKASDKGSDKGSAVKILMIEATNNHFQLPDKGLVGQHAIFDPAMLETPKIDADFKHQQTEKPWKVFVKKRQSMSVIHYPFNPLDAKGWKGDLIPVKINWRDIRPLMSHRFHLPPSAHTTFVAKGFVVCTFVPRPIETDPGALKVPFYHSNDDYDEFIFYHKGEFFSRDNIHPGMTTLHPAGFTHGPHPKAFATAQLNPKKATDEVAVMVDTRQPLDVLDAALVGEWEDYRYSWQTKV